MKMLVRTFTFLFAMTIAVGAMAQAPATAAEQAAKATTKSKTKTKRKAAKTVTTTATPAPVDATHAAEAAKPANGGVTLEPVPATPAPAAPAASATGDGAQAGGPKIDPVTGEVIPDKLTTISFEEVSFDFGKIKEGDIVKHKFKFTNTGTNDLILENVKPSCGCTALDWPKDPIAPGKTGEIEAQFNSTGKSGVQTKYITITLNSAERLERITFTGEVIPKPVEPGSETPAPAPTH